MLFGTALNHFKNNLWIQALEDELDEDRMYGEWEVKFNFN